MSTGGLQHERTTLAWERTAIATMVAGVLLARWAAESSMTWFAGFGIAQVMFGSGLLVWSSTSDSTRPAATRVVGLATTAGIGGALVLAIITVVS